MTFYTWNCPPLRGPRLAAVNNDSKDETDKVIQDLNIDGIWQMDLSESYAKEGEYERWQVEITTNGRSIQFKDVTAPDSRPNLKGNITPLGYVFCFSFNFQQVEPDIWKKSHWFL